MKREAMGHTKLKRLCRRLDLALWQAVGLLETLWHLTARETPRGDIGKLSNEDIALALDYRGDENRLIDALETSGWIDRNDIYRLVIHDWQDHADDAVQLRLARAREFFCSGSVPKFSRLSLKERESLEAYYTSCAQQAEPCAQTIESCTPPEPEPLPEPVPIPEPSPEPKQKPLVKGTPLPPWLDLEAWEAYEEMRKKIRKPMTDRARELVLKKLAGFEARGIDSTEALNRSVLGNWTDVYEPKEQTGGIHDRRNRAQVIAESTNATLALRNARTMDVGADSNGGGAYPVTTARSLFERSHAQLVAKNPG
jgi:hypothetical protein